MDNERTIEQLKSLIDNSKSFIYPGGDNEIWEENIEALNIAIEAVGEVEKLKQEVVHFMKRCVQAERLLAEAEKFCLIVQRNEIRDFLRN